MKFKWENEDWCLPDPDIKQGSKLTFGEFLEAKTQVAGILGVNDGYTDEANIFHATPLEERKSSWHVLLSLSAIFLRKEEEEYEESFLFEDSERLKLMKELPLSIAKEVGIFYEKLNESCNEFPCFHDSKAKSGRHMQQHYNEMGYIRFLKDIALTHVFDMPGSGLNSIQALRKASLFDVLLYASEEKLYAEAQYMDQKEESKRNTVTE